MEQAALSWPRSKDVGCRREGHGVRRVLTPALSRSSPGLILVIPGRASSSCICQCSSSRGGRQLLFGKDLPVFAMVGFP